MPRPRSLTPDRIAEAALAVIDADGLAALSMKAVAARLGMGTMSLYRYVADRAELEELVVERVLADVSTGDAEGTWRERVMTLAERVRAAVGRHPNALPLIAAHRDGSPSLARWTEAVLVVLTGAGFAGRERVVALRALVAHLLGAVELEHRGPLGGRSTRRMTELAAFPLLAETARDALALPPDEEFRRGLDLLLDGLEGASRR
ncbi:TetR/AcrR family transcriptional regulator [Actinocorallia sp. A-T 12471]|uniref:TetR/AcrR family transcriptional regulator n=1 Tax=Actinocorallia sp. A-T 12471 TaxID=3089813 RepID=UPI0029CB454B|nr:TetR/AcrR family transcriptional regulator C-terminal domain-containing protein [Actinocorallia sp. A-T 12471]MDX6738648.1 TetR/AcrR family transcriptional regulator C-terminal domain-containing protein [Actinocorallia sp. A-T 12471]